MRNQDDENRYAEGFETPVPPVPPAPPQYVPQQYAQPAPPYAQPAHPYPQPAPPYVQHPLPYAPAYSPVRPTNGFAIAAMVCGIVGMFVSPFIVVFFVPIVMPIAAVVLGHIARSQIKRAPHTAGSGMAITGLILGYIPIVLSALLLVLLIIGFALFGTVMTMPGMMS